MVPALLADWLARRPAPWSPPPGAQRRGAQIESQFGFENWSLVRFWSTDFMTSTALPSVLSTRGSVRELINHDCEQKNHFYP